MIYNSCYFINDSLRLISKDGLREHKDGETMQRLICHNNTFSQIVRSKKAMSKRNIFLFIATFICNAWSECKL